MKLRRADAGKVELDGARYLGFNLPFSISQLVWIEAILVGGAEIYRNRELDSEKRIYPGIFTSLPFPGPHRPLLSAPQGLCACFGLRAQSCARKRLHSCARWVTVQDTAFSNLVIVCPGVGGYFDPLSLASGEDAARTFKLKEAELKHGRLAMVAFLGEFVCPAHCLAPLS